MAMASLMFSPGWCGDSVDKPEIIFFTNLRRIRDNMAKSSADNEVGSSSINFSDSARRIF